jgi:hypothetical protein
VDLLQPAAGDTVGGDVFLLAAVWSEMPVRAVTFLVDGEAVEKRLEPPWEIRWSVEASGTGTGRILQAEAEVEGPGRDELSLVRSKSVSVWAVPDAPPHVQIHTPRNAAWIERQAGGSIAATAEDPEEGTLPGDRLVWSVEGFSRAVRGGRLPLEFLPDGERKISVEAKDSWGCRGQATARLVVFRYRSPLTPEDCLWNLGGAIRALDSVAWAAALAPRFRFVPCPGEAEGGGWPRVWTKEDFIARLERYLNDVGDGPIEFAFVPGRAMTWHTQLGGEAWITIGEMSLRRHPAGADPSTPGALSPGLPRATDGLTEDGVFGSGADLLFSTTTATGWQILEWRDRPGEQGISLACVMAQTAGLRAAPPGARCHP